VNGQEYTSGRIDALTAGGADYPDHYLARYPTGTNVHVHVNPKNPSDAVLEATWPIGTTMKAIVSLLIAVLLFSLANVERQRYAKRWATV